MAEDVEQVEVEDLTFREVALELAKGMLASGAFNENLDGAIVTAWTVGIPAFIRGEQMFAAMFAGQAPSPEDFKP